jgi:hypothetical protein
MTDEQKEKLAAYLKEMYDFQLERQLAGDPVSVNRTTARVVGFLKALEIIGVKEEIYAMATRKDNGSEQLSFNLE